MELTPLYVGNISINVLSNTFEKFKLFVGGCRKLIGNTSIFTSKMEI